MSMASDMNMLALKTSASEIWLARKDASKFFARMTSAGRMQGSATRLQRAVDNGSVRTRTSGSGRTKYNAWDCMQACRIL